MPPLPSIANVLRHRITFNIGGKPTQGVRIFLGHSGGTPTATALNNLCTQITTLAAFSTLPNEMHPDNEIESVYLEDLSSTMGAVGSGAANAVGTRAGGPLPADASFVTSYPIPRHYRGGHPRSYWPLGTDTDLTNPQKWTNTAVSEFQTTLRAYIAALIGLTSGGITITDHAAVSYYAGFTVVTNPLTGRARNVPTLRVVPVINNCGLLEGRTYVGSFRRRRLVAA